MFADPVWTGTLAFLLVFAAIAAAGYWTLLRGSGEQRKAVSRLRGLGARPQTTPQLPPISGGFWRGALELIARAGSTKTAQVEVLRKKCLNAGFFHPRAPMIFVGAQLLLILTLTVGGALLSFWALSGGGSLKPAGGVLARIPPWMKLSLFALSGATAGMLAPSWWLSTQVQKRQRLLRHAFPDALDMLVLCLEGGVSINAAIQRVTDELQVVHPVLGMEMNIVEREMQLGLSASEALRKFGDRCGLTDVSDLAIVLLQSEKYGASLTKTLRGYVEGARINRQQKAEEMAQKAAVKILFPTLLCIFPAIFVVVLGPAAFQIATMFSR
jgi:tight adherence protein C